MPTSSERLTVRAGVYWKTYRELLRQADEARTTTEAEELERLAKKLTMDYDRLMKLAAIRAKKEKALEHRRKPQG